MSGVSAPGGTEPGLQAVWSIYPQFLPRVAGQVSAKLSPGGVWATGLRLTLGATFPRIITPARALRLVAYPRQATSLEVCPSGEELVSNGPVC